MNLHWIIDVDIIGEHNIDVPVFLKSLGYKVTALSVTKEFPKIQSDENYIFVFIGSFEELRRIKKQIPSVTTYGIGSSILRSHYTSYFDKSWFLNNSSIMTTWGNFCKDSDFYFSMFSDNCLFIRPDSGYKTFTGQTIEKSKFETQQEILKQTSSILPETIIWVDVAKNINKEYRFWISDKKIIGQSEYSWNDDDIGNFIPTEAIEFAQKVASHDWQPDRMYVVDIHLTDNNIPSIIEFNSFSCSGLYNCDAKTMLKMASIDILKEWSED